MAVVHCLGTGLVGAWVAKRLATLGHEVHAYDLQPHRVMGIDGITVHQGDVHPIEIIKRLRITEQESFGMLV